MANHDGYGTGLGFNYLAPSSVAQHDQAPSLSSFPASQIHQPHQPGLYTNCMSTSLPSTFMPSSSAVGLIQFPSPCAPRVGLNSQLHTTNSVVADSIAFRNATVGGQSLSSFAPTHYPHQSSGPGLYSNSMSSSSPSTFNSSSGSTTGLIQFPSPCAPRMAAYSQSYTLNSVANCVGFNNGSVGHSNSWQSIVPNNMPWGVSQLTSANLMRFTGTSSMHTTMQASTMCSGLNYSPLCSVIHPSSSLLQQNTHKRKASTVEEGVKNKVFINEDRMSAHMQKMHLDNNNLEWHPNLEDDASWYHTRQGGSGREAQAAGSGSSSSSAPSPHTVRHRQIRSFASPSSSSDDEDGDSRKKSGMTTLELAKELQLNVTTKEILPQVILDEIVRPQMQVVLWHPQPDFIRGLVRERSSDGATNRLPDICCGGERREMTAAVMDLVEMESAAESSENKTTRDEVNNSSPATIPWLSQPMTEAPSVNSNNIDKLQLDFDDDDDMEL